MRKKLVIPAMAATILLAGCSTGDLDAVKKDVEALKQEVSALKATIGDNNQGASNIAEQTETEAPGQKAPDEQGFYALGEPFVFEQITYTVTESERQPQLSNNIKAGEGKEFALFTIDIHNTSHDDYHYSQSFFDLVTGSGEIKDNYLILDLNDQLDDLGSGDLAPGGKRSGWVAFEVPQGDQPLELRFDSRNKESFKVKLR